VIPRLILFLVASMLSAETMFRLNLAGDWRFMAGDNLAYAASGFDDSAWTTRSLPRQADPPMGYSWLRRRFVLPSNTLEGPLFITLGTLADGYEIWCNGVRIGDTGGFSDADLHFARPRTFTVPPGLLQPGRPFTVALLSEIDNSGTGRSILGFGANDRPNVVGNPEFSNPTTSQWFNTAAFAFPAPGTFGNAGRNILDGPGYQNVNASLVKNTHLTEQVNLQFRAEFFNLFNHPNFNLPDNFLGSPTFGVISSAREPRHIQFGLKLLF